MAGVEGRDAGSADVSVFIEMGIRRWGKLWRREKQNSLGDSPHQIGGGSRASVLRHIRFATDFAATFYGSSGATPVV